MNMFLWIIGCMMVYLAIGIAIATTINILIVNNKMPKYFGNNTIYRDYNNHDKIVDTFVWFIPVFLLLFYIIIDILCFIFVGYKHIPKIIDTLSKPFI